MKKAIIICTLCLIGCGGSDSQIRSIGLKLAPAPPSNLVATANSSCSIGLSWNDNSNNETGFKLERSTNGTSFSQFTTVGANVTTYNDNGRVNNKTYWYRVRAYKTSPTQNSSYSNVSSATTSPTLLASTVTVDSSSSTAVTLSWTNGSTNETGFLIERGLDLVTFSSVGTTGTDQMTFTDNSVVSGTQYYYRVFATENGCNNGPVSNVVVTGACDNLPPSSSAKDMWLWYYETSMKTTLLNFAVSKGVRTIYVESEYMIQNDWAALEDLITSADMVGVKIDLLYGNSTWALSGNHSIPINLAQLSVNFYNSLSGAKPYGVHFDIEPYLLSQWTTNQNSVANQYIDLMESLKTVINGSGMMFTTDMPFWYETVTVTRNSQTRPFYEWIMDLTDISVIMDYRDKSTVPNGIIDLITEEMNYTKNIGKKLVIGVETQCGLTNNLTFCEEGEAAMNSALLNAAQAYCGYSSYNGSAIHYYDSWVTLLP